MATQDLDHRLGDPETRKLIAFDRGERYGSIGLVLLVAVALVGAAVGYLLVGHQFGGECACGTRGGEALRE